MNLPNALTASRLVAIPVLMVLLVGRFAYHDQLAAAIFVVASLTDTLDGNLARQRGQVTELGKFLDPLADKLFILSVLIVLVQEGAVPAWVVLVIFSRELLITVLRSLSASQGRVIAATPWGKTKTVSQVIAVLLLILQRPYPALQLPARLVVGFAVAFTVLSGVDYLWRFRHVFLSPTTPATPEGPAGPGASAGKAGEAGEVASAEKRSLAVPAGGAPGAESPVNPLARRVGDRLAAAGTTVAVAESCTGGLLAAAITDNPGSSAYFQGGIVAYSNAAKEAFLQVPAQLIEQHGAVSAEVARAMAEGARRALGADLGVAITGIAGPDSDGTSKPVGLTYVWVAGRGSGQGRTFTFQGDRWSNRRQAVDEALALLGSMGG